MSTATAIVSANEYVHFGQSQINSSIETFVMTLDEFEALGGKVLKHLGALRRKDFNLTTQMLDLGCTDLDNLNAFLLLEELTVLITEMKNPLAVVPLKQIYHALKLQAYRTCRITVKSHQAI